MQMKTNKKWIEEGGKVTWNEGAWVLSPVACGGGGGGWESR